MTRTNLFILIFVLLLFSACSHHHKPQPQEFNGLYTGRINHVVLKGDTSQSYEIYLPLSYKHQGKLPIIWGFDAHGDGKQLVDWLRPWAEKYGYIVAASNTFRNNVPNLERILDNFFSDVSSKVKYNEQRQYTAGFSGGARIAYYLAAEDERFSGTAMLSAGLSSLPYIKNKKLSVIAFAGWKDFNLIEIRGESRELAKKYNIPFLPVYFDGGHEYPPQNLAELVPLWFDFRSMQTGQMKKDRKVIRRAHQLIDSMLYATDDPMMKYDIYSMAITLFNGIDDTHKYEKKQEELTQTAEFKEAAKIVTNFFNLEAMLQPQYYKLVFKRDTAWWYHEINAFNQKIRQDSNKYRLFFYHRIKAYLGIMSFSVANEMARKEDTAKLHKILLIYQKLEPQNPDVYLFWSCYWLTKGDVNKGREFLRKSRELGFSEPERLEQYPCFQKYKSQLVQ